MTTGSTASTLIALVRHGQSESNLNGHIGGHSTTPLTELGHRQARATAEALMRDFEPTALISSDLVRARQTAEPICELTGLDLGLDARLRERSVGVLDGLSFAQAAELHPEHWQRLRDRDPDCCPPGGETVAAVFERISQVIDEIAHEHLGGRVVVVSHGLAIFHAFAHICGLGSPARGLRVFSLVDNCSISRFSFRSAAAALAGDRRDYWLLDSMNDRAHLRGLT